MWHNSQINSWLLVQIKHVIDTFNIYANKQYICFVKSISFSYKSSLLKVHFVVIEIFTAKQSMIFLIKTFDYAQLFLDGVMKIFLCLIDFNQRLIIFQLRVCCRVFLSEGKTFFTELSTLTPWDQCSVNVSAKGGWWQWRPLERKRPNLQRPDRLGLQRFCMNLHTTQTSRG